MDNGNIYRNKMQGGKAQRNHELQELNFSMGKSFFRCLLWGFLHLLKYVVQAPESQM